MIVPALSVPPHSHESPSFDSVGLLSPVTRHPSCPVALSPVSRLLTPVACLLTIGSPQPVAAADKAPAKITVQLDWVAEPEHGGFYQAEARGFFREEGLDVRLIPGGPGAHVMPSVATGKADIGQADSTNTLLQQAEGLPVVQFAAVFQDDPSGILVHADSSVRTFKDLQDRTIIARPEWAFLKFLQKKYSLKFTIVPQNFSVAAFLSNKDALQQGYFIAEPYHITKAGGKHAAFSVHVGRGFSRLRGAGDEPQVCPGTSEGAAARSCAPTFAAGATISRAIRSRRTTR